jgi:hypothetical protein
MSNFTCTASAQRVGMILKAVSDSADMKNRRFVEKQSPKSDKNQSSIRGFINRFVDPDLLKTNTKG